MSKNCECMLEMYIWVLLRGCLDLRLGEPSVPIVIIPHGASCTPVEREAKPRALRDKKEREEESKDPRESSGR